MVKNKNGKNGNLGYSLFCKDSFHLLEKENTKFA